MTVDSIEQIYSLSPMQEGLLFHSLLAPESGVYFEQFCFTLRGKLNVGALRQAWQMVTDRHAILRTSFHWEGLESSVQVVHKQATVPFVEWDWRGLPSTEQERQLDFLLQEDRRRGFDMTEAPLMRFTLIRVEDEVFHLIWSHHHILVDGWSGSLINREVFACYSALAKGNPVELETPRPYQDYILWLQDQDPAEAETYWRTLLAGFSAPTPLGADHTPGALPSRDEDYDSLQINLTREDSAAVKSLAHAHRLTINTIAQAAWAVLLSRYGGESDVVFGTVVSGRPVTLPGAESIIGLMVNTLPTRVQLTPKMTGLQLFTALQNQQVETRQYEYVALTEIQGWSDVPRDLPLFETNFAFENYPIEDSLEAVAGDIELQNVRFFEKTNFALSVQVSPGDELHIRIMYDTRRFDRATIERMLSHLQTIVQQMVAHPERQLASLSILTEAEKQALVVDWNQTVAPYPLVCLHDWFAAQVERTPYATAVEWRHGKMTYRELNRRADQLAEYLAGNGVGPDVPVVLCLDRSPDMVVAVMGILKAGGAYVPVDPAYPQERKAFIVSDTQSPLILTAQSLADDFLATSVRVVCLDTEWERITASTATIPKKPELDTLAYVIYTSGSTGKPKGAMLSHRGVVNYLHWAARAYAPETGHGAPVHSSLGFDLTVTSFFLPLLTGKTIHLVPEGQGIEALLETLRTDTDWSLLKITPAHLQALNQLLTPADADRQPKTIVIGGEALKAEHLAFWRRNAPEVKLINEYGPTETVVGCCVYEVQPKDLGSGMVPIGRPISNLRLYVADSDMQPVPVGVTGELFIAGTGLARGYVGRPDLTAERFIPNPWSLEPGERLYRTGDTARFLDNGCLEFLGRTDSQVKIRGYRIELGEIETVLGQHPAVRDAAVLVRDGLGGEKSLAAYIVPESRIEFLEEASLNALPTESIKQWHQVFEHSYTKGPEMPQTDPTFNIAGWNSSLTGKAIPPEEMREWVDQTVDRILAWNPERVYEIGCGSGLLLFRIAPVCREYRGNDFSVAALRSIENVLRDRPMPQVALSERTAEDFSGVEAGSFDVVVINSVAQYFPSCEYLVEVVHKAVTATASGGCIYLGDLRNRNVLDLFHTAVQLQQVPDDMPLEEFRHLVQKRLSQEEELVIDPAFFHALARQMPEIRNVQIQLRRGSSHNELTCYRYDVMLQIGGGVHSRDSEEMLDWQHRSLTPALFRRHLMTSEADALIVRRIPNARLITDRLISELLKKDQGLKTVGALRDAAGQAAVPDAVDPETIWQIGEELGYGVEISWSESDPTCFDATFISFQSTLQSQETEVVTKPVTSVPDLALRSYTNAPLVGKIAKKLVPRLRNFLEEKLPDYMVPASFMVLESFPLTVNGKVDRAALPAPDSFRIELKAAYVAPQTELETTITNVWTDVLGIEHIGVEDNFFRLGGHSLLATQLVSRLRGELELDIPLRIVFEAPTVKEMARFIADLQASGESDTEAPLIPVSRDETLPLSFSQQRLWFLDQFEPGGSAFNMPQIVRLKGHLDISALQHSLQALVDRHESLRTVFRQIDGQPVQIINPVAGVPIGRRDFRDLSKAEREAAIQQFVREESERPFDLASGPLFRAGLAQIEDQEFVLALTMHHIVSDAWSLWVLIRELAAFYRDFHQGHQPTLNLLPLQYADFASWQRRHLQGAVLAKHLTYWKTQLEGITPLELPFDHPRTFPATHRGGMESITLPLETSRAVKAFGQAENATLFMTLLAGFQVFLGRHCGQEDIAVGVPIANRNRAETEGLIGFFLNLLTLRTDLSGDPTFQELVARVKEVALGAYAHQDLPFEKLIEELQPERDLERPPLFDVMFNLINTPRTTLALPELQLELMEAGDPRALYALNFYVGEEGEQLVLHFVYNADLFEAATISGWLTQFSVLLDSAVTRPAQRLSVLPLFAQDETPPVPAPMPVPENPFTFFSAGQVEQSIPDRFQAQARQFPNRIAVRTTTVEMTYARLDAESDRVARTILERVTTEKGRIGLLLGHNEKTIIGILGVLKTGFAYVPLDPSHPVERLIDIMTDAEVSALVWDDNHLELASKLAHFVPEHCSVDEIPSLTSEGVLTNRTAPDDVAYLLYTSGSTGKPKGVIQSHRNVLHHCRAYTNQLHICLEDRLSWLAAYGFDAAVMDIFGALLNGATLCPFDVRTNGLDRLPAWVVDQRITIYHSTPTVYRYFVTTLNAGIDLTSLRLVVLGGEEVFKRDFDQFVEHFPGHCLFVNGLGPTESTITLQQFMNRESMVSGSTVPVGFPVTETQVLVLNGDGEPVAPLAAGEIVIRSPFVALGYWHRPDLTQKAFAVDDQDSRFRRYRTGDIGRFQPDGTLEFMGRRDFQVKIRGHRIELNEIEAKLLTCSWVKEAVVVAIPVSSEEKRLAGYVVPRAGFPADLTGLREMLKATLPAPMVPAAITILEALPLTPNGKLNRHALPVPDWSEAIALRQMVAPRTPTEVILERIWAKILGRPQVGVLDNFFDLGGHSLLAVRLRAEIQQQFNQDFPLALLFQYSTIEQLARCLDQAISETVWSPLTPIQPEGQRTPFFCVHPAGGNVLGYADLARRLGTDQPFWGLQATGLDGRQAPLTSVAEMAERYVLALREVQPSGPYVLGGASMGGVVAFEMARQLKAAGEEIQVLALFDSWAPQLDDQLGVEWARSVDLSHPKAWDTLVVVRAIREMAEQLGRDLPALYRDLLELDEEAQISCVLKLASEAGTVLPEGGHSIARALLAVYRANLEAMRTYQPQPYQGDVVLFRALETDAENDDPTLGWNAWIQGQLQVFPVPGNHRTLLLEPNVTAITDQLSACLREEAIGFRVQGSGFGD